MKTQTTTYTYDPSARSLTIFIDGRPRGGFSGPEAETRLSALLESGAEISFTNMNTESQKKALIRAFHACLAKQGVMDYKPDILGRYGVEHTTDLDIAQLLELVEEFSGYQRQMDSSRLRSLRSDLLSILQHMGIYATNNDWTAVNNFCMKHAGKMMYQMNEEDLLKARKQFNSILDWYLGKQNEVKRMQTLN